MYQIKCFSISSISIGYTRALYSKCTAWTNVTDELSTACISRYIGYMWIYSTRGLQHELDVLQHVKHIVGETLKVLNVVSVAPCVLNRATN